MKKKSIKLRSLFNKSKIKRLSNVFVLPLLAVLMLFSCGGKELVNTADVVVLINSEVAEKSVAEEKVAPYLNNFGVKYKIVDITKGVFPTQDDPALVIVGHSGITKGDKDLTLKLENCLEQCQKAETGILSFDPQMPQNLLAVSGDKLEKDSDVGALRFADEKHYISGYRQPGELKELFGYMSIPKMSVKEGQVVITGNDQPLLVVNSNEKGRVAQWTSQDWMFYSILGPLGGLDDCLWKSIVWAARKPFVMQALPPLATFRIDDVMGTGRQQWDVSPFNWVKVANKYGFKPWMGLFLYNITPEGIEELKELIPAGMATGTPHAFGRPPRKESIIENVRAFKPYYSNQMAATHFVPNYWNPNAIPYLSKYYDEFVYFDHNNQKPWSDEVSKKILKAVDDWYSETGIPMGKFLIPHWGQISSNMMPHIKENWEIDLVAIREVDKSWGQQSPEYNLKGGKKPVTTAPFRLYDEPIVGKAKENAPTSRAAYNASFRDFGGREFFDFSSSINDITGFEWQPDNNVDATAERGFKMLARGLESKALAVLFTHETDYIYLIKPENWEAIFKQMSEKVSIYNPIHSTTDDAVKILRAFNTSEIQDSSYDQTSGQLTVKMSGKTDVPTSVYIYTNSGESVDETLLEVPVFENEVSVSEKVQLSK